MFRKHPTELMHSDTWTGANPNWCAVHIFILGDIAKNNIRYAEPPKNFNENLNFKMSNMNMNIKIQYLKNSDKFQSPYWINKKKLDNYILPSFTKKIVQYLERN